MEDVPTVSFKSARDVLLMLVVNSYVQHSSLHQQTIRNSASRLQQLHFTDVLMPIDHLNSFVSRGYTTCSKLRAPWEWCGSLHISRHLLPCPHTPATRPHTYNKSSYTYSRSSHTCNSLQFTHVIQRADVLGTQTHSFPWIVMSTSA